MQISSKYVLPTITVLFIVLISILNISKTPYVWYLPFEIPGKQMAATIPPFGIFIESEYKNEKVNDKCSILTHELIHWQQYRRMGLFSFHFNYIKLYLTKGRIDNWMEEEARMPCMAKPIAVESLVDRILIEKAPGTMSLLSDGVVLKTYKVSLGKKPVGDKVCEGDNRTPEGIYYIWEKCPSKFHKSLKISYPDNAEAHLLGKSPGGGIQIHGLGEEYGWLGKIHLLKDWTAGCIAVTNREIDELYTLVQTGTPVEIME